MCKPTKAQLEVLELVRSSGSKLCYREGIRGPDHVYARISGSNPQKVHMGTFRALLDAGYLTESGGDRTKTDYVLSDKGRALLATEGKE